MPKLTWFPFYINDYLSDTMFLTAEEHGAYLLLIMHYYRLGELPNDDVMLSKLSKTGARWKKISENIKKFFEVRELTPHRLNHNRIDNELAKSLKMHDARVAGGRARAEQMLSSSLAEAQVQLSSTSGNLQSHSHIQSQKEDLNEEDRKIITPKPPQNSLTLVAARQASLSVIKADFEKFWKAYPRKVGRGGAEKAFEKAIKLTTLDVMLDGITGLNTNDPKYIPHPATWLNQKRWMDEKPLSDEQRISQIIANASSSKIWDKDDDDTDQGTMDIQTSLPRIA
jgi:uncharacterized protein YdaU (DUF1376 family)